LNLAGQFDVASPENSLLLYTIWHAHAFFFSSQDVQRYCSAVDPQKLAEIERVLLKAIHSQEQTIETKSTGYQSLFYLYQDQKMDEKVIELYEGNKAEVLRLPNPGGYVGCVIDAYNKLQKYEEASQLGQTLEEQVDVTLPENIYLTRYLSIAYAHCQAGEGTARIAKLENFFLSGINSDALIEHKNYLYSPLIDLYTNQNRYEKIVDLYTSKKEEMLQAKEFNYFSRQIFHACILLENYDLALDILNHQTNENEEDALSRALNYAVTYKAKGEPEKAMGCVVTLEEALSSQSNLGQTPEENAEKLTLEVVCPPKIGPGN
jgi:hypothetical protein